MVYPAETVSFEKKPYHVECFRCANCDKKTDAAHAAQFEDKIYDKQCFANLGFAQKQRQVKWEKKEGTETTSSVKVGGGGTLCVVCQKTVYPAETVLFEKRPFHQECFKCSSCEAICNTSGAGLFEEKLYCKKCFEREGFAQKQRQVKWEKKEGDVSAAPSKFGGGGNPCTACGKTVYPAETVSYEKKIFHQDCLSCSECGKKCTPSGCAMFENKIYCSLCFERGGYREKQLKAGVNKAGGATVDPRFAKFGGGGNKCRTCGETVYPAETINYEKNTYHQKCFACLHCKKELDASGAEHDGPDVYCKKCFHELGLNRARLKDTHKEGEEQQPQEQPAAAGEQQPPAEGGEQPVSPPQE